MSYNSIKVNVNKKLIQGLISPNDYDLGNIYANLPSSSPSDFKVISGCVSQPHIH